MKYWEILLLKQRERGNDGWTIPFLIGSQQYLANKSNQGIASLVHDMATRRSIETCIRHCMGTQTFIAEIRKRKNSVYYPTFGSGEQTNLAVGIMSKSDLGEVIDQVIETLIDKFQDAIDNGRYSAEPNVDGRSVNWRDFSPDDITFIRDSFNSL